MKTNLSSEQQVQLNHHKQHWNLGEFAYINGLSVPFVRNEIRDGNLKAKKFGKRWLISRESAEEYYRHGSIGAEANNKQEGNLSTFKGISQVQG